MAKERRPNKPFDTTFKHLVEMRPRDVLAFLGVLDVRDVKLIDADVSTVVAAVDKVLRVETGQGEFLVHLEFQTGQDADLDARLFGYNALLYRQHRLPVWSVLFLLTPAADNARWNGTLEISMPTGRRCLAFDYHVIRIWQLETDAVMESGLGLLPLAPLCRDADTRLAGVIDGMAERLQREATNSERETIWAATYFLMGLRYDAAFARRVISRGSHMLESATYQATLAEEARKILMRLGRVRFGEPPAQVVLDLDRVESVAALEDLNERLLNVTSWGELLAPKPRRRRNGKKG